ncbi:hypothetical protein PH210_06220 [Paenibacillus sp. BSR1-1]|uniref:hypothetical protein n=1 Tax=Paenibacillus sp. BSR1-1 TaxID=3020845 RepID=UPI0025AEEE26|nr:hypothetical protein [Paenibacillus sp. BSR1-1]MDN3015801.1 hypothetical protein [Paenibacillus sp. BSR1-1]
MEIQCLLTNSNYSLILDNNEEKVVPETRYSLSILGLLKQESYNLYINDQFILKISNGYYSTLVDLINNIGYHKLNITNNDNKIIFQTFFYTNSYKMEVEDFYKMIQFVQKEIFWINNQFIYYDHENRQHEIVEPLFIFNWIDKHFDIIEKLVLKINHLNFQLRDTENFKTFMNTSRYDKPKTITFLRNNQHFLSESNSQSGLLQVNDRYFQPQTVIGKKVVTHYKLNEHKQIYELVLLIYRFLSTLKETLKKERYDSIRQECFKKIENNRFIKRLMYLKNNTFLKDFSTKDLLYINRYPKSKLQLNYPAYGGLYDLYSSFINNYYQVITMKNDTFYQHIKNIDKIYEAFCCYVLADILDLAATDTSKMLISGLAFQNETVKFYYQGKPNDMIGWAVSDVPDIIIRNNNGKTILLDCKFKMKDRTTVKGEDIQKIQAYLNNYHLGIGGITYPGTEYYLTIDEVMEKYILIHLPIYPITSEIYKPFKARIKRDFYLLLEE